MSFFSYVKWWKWLLAAAFCVTLWAQPMPQDWLREEQYEKALQLYNLEEPTTETDSLALSIFLKVATSAGAGLQDSLSLNSLLSAANIHQTYQRHPEAKALYHQVLNRADGVANRSRVAYEANLYLGSSMYFTNYFDSARHYFEQASSIATKERGRTYFPEEDRLYNSLGALYFESANYTQAMNYFQLALSFISNRSEEYQDSYAGIQNNIANCLMKMNRFDSALALLVRVKKLGSHERIINQNIAQCHFETGNYDEALGIYADITAGKDFSSVVALSNMGRIHLRKQAWQQAEMAFDSAISLNKSISDSIKNKEEAMAYLYRSQLAEAMGLMDEAFTWVNEAIKEVHLQFVPGHQRDLPEDVSKSISPITMFLVMQQKANLLYKKYRELQVDEDLFAAVNAYGKAIETANFIRINFDNDEAKLFFNNYYRPIFSKAIQTAWEAHEKDPAFADDFLNMLENYKGSVILQNLQQSVRAIQANGEDSLLNREAELRQLLSIYYTKLNQSISKDDAQFFENRLITLQVELSRLRQRIRQQGNTDAGNYYMPEEEVLTMRRLQHELPASTALLNYYVADSAIFCLAANRQDYTITRLPMHTDFRRSAEALLHALYQPQEGKRYGGTLSGWQVQQTLVAPHQQVLNGRAHWVICPDGLLSAIPFDALPTDTLQKAYLLQRATISYHYSAGLLLFEQGIWSKRDEGPESYIGFAPFFEASEDIRQSGFALLPESREELKVNGTVLLHGALATKRRFLAGVTRYSHVHIASHASLGPDSATNFIQFYPEKGDAREHRVYVHDIYATPLAKTRLVVLSACETGGGLAAAGEGLLSLSRAFIYAGSGGVVSTLWRTEDFVTAYLMRRMNSHLAQQKDPASALQAAKMDLLKDPAIDPHFKTPNYWANFVYAGVLQTNRPHVPAYQWALLAIAMLIAGIWYTIWKKQTGAFQKPRLS